MTMRKFIFFVLLVFLATPNFGRGAVDGRRASILDHGPGVAAQGMGEAFTAGGDDLSVINYNPSLLMTLDRSQVYGMHWFLFEGARYNFLGWAQLLESGAFAISATQLYRDDIEVRQNLADTPSRTSNSQVFLQGSYAGKYDRFHVNYGGTLRYFAYKLYDNSATAFAGDFGVSRELYRSGTPMKHRYILSAGANAQNLVSTPLKLKEEAERISPLLRAGARGSATFFPRYSKEKDAFAFDLLSLELNLAHTDSAARVLVGAEYFFRDRVFLRAGWNKNATAGFGFIWNDMRFDYAWIPSEFATLNQVSVLYKFGKEAERESQPFADEFQSTFKKAQRIYERYYRDAVALVENRKYRTAADILFRTIPLKPKENSSALELYNTCQNAMISEKVGEHLSEAKEREARNDYPAAYAAILEALDASPQDRNLLIFMDVSQQVLPSQKSKVDAMADQFIIKVAARIDAALQGEDFLKAEGELKKIKALIPKSSRYESLANKIADLKQLYTQRILTQAIHHLQDDKPESAFDLYSAALRLNPDDPTIKDQKFLAQNLYTRTRKFTLKDKLYADKLYYNAAIAFATNEDAKAVQSLERLRSFNPVHDFIEDLEVSMKDKRSSLNK